MVMMTMTARLLRWPRRRRLMAMADVCVWGGAGAAQALQAAEEAIVLLRNEPPTIHATAASAAVLGSGGPLLPLSLGSAGRPLRVGVLGPMAAPFFGTPDDKGDYCPAFQISPLAGLQEAAAASGGQLVVHECLLCCARETSHETPPPCDLKRSGVFAASVDVVVLCLGGNLGGEGRDWAGVLPSDQARLAGAVLVANHRSVAVLIHGNPMSIDRIATGPAAFPAIVDAFEGGQAAGTALARVLLGTSAVGPSGVMPYTVYPDNYTSTVSMTDMSMRAGPGRTYRFYTGRPTYPFGWGLTYTTWRLQWAGQLPAARQRVAWAAEHGLRFHVRATNTGARRSAKVVAAYISIFPTQSIGSKEERPPAKALFALQKVMLAPGESGTVTLDSHALAGFCSLCAVDDEGVSMVGPGNLTVSVGDGGRGAGTLSHRVTLTE
eukprot:COSAG01_NODE_4730_length_4786_cov_12.836996_3_plen_436_part_00